MRQAGNRKLWSMLLVLSLLFTLTACSGETISPAQEEKKEELAQDFMLELRDEILVYREIPRELIAKNVVYTDDKGTQGFELLDAFWTEYQAGNDCELTIAFNTTTYVVVRVAFVDGNGYYYRYVLNDETIAVSSMHIDELKLNQKNTKIELVLLNDGKDIKTFSLKYKLVEPEPEGEDSGD